MFKFTQKGSYITNTLVFPNMSISVSIQCEANRGGPVVFVVTVHIISILYDFKGIRSSCILRIFNQYLMHLVYVEIYIGYLPVSP